MGREADPFLTGADDTEQHVEDRPAPRTSRSPVACSEHWPTFHRGCEFCEHGARNRMAQGIEKR